jgi:hypothetical protein
MLFMTALPFASIQNEHLRLDYLTTTGPRIIGLFANGLEGNLLAETPAVHWSTPHGEYYLRGGHRLWTAPEDPFYNCPEDGLEVIDENDCVILRGLVDASGLQKEIAIRLEKNTVHLSHRVTWHGKEPIRFAPWAITQLRLGGMAILPMLKTEGLLPDRKLVFWPYSDIKDERHEFHNDLIVVHGRAADHAFKLGNYNPLGWVACALENVLFLKRFPVNEKGKYPDLGCNVEVYVKDSYLELETLGVLKTLSTHESITHEETWEIIVGKYPATLTGARTITKQLSQSQKEWSNNG